MSTQTQQQLVDALHALRQEEAAVLALLEQRAHIPLPKTAARAPSKRRAA